MSDLNKDSSLLNVLSFTAEKTAELAGTNSVVGEIIERDGITVIPISKISVGFAGGGADIADVSRKKKQNPAGAGAKVTMTPVSFLVISNGSAEVISVNNEGGSIGITELVSTAIKKFKELKDKKSSK